MVSYCSLGLVPPSMPLSTMPGEPSLNLQLNPCGHQEMLTYRESYSLTIVTWTFTGVYSFLSPFGLKVCQDVMCGGGQGNKRGK